MNTKFENMALLNIEDYNELKAKAEATDEQIKKQAEEMAKPEVVTLKVCFDTYGLLYRPNTCVDVEIPFYDDEKIRDMLNKASADIMKWCDKNMIKYNKELKESRSTKKHCEGLRKHIANLERRLLRHTLANVILSIISVATIIALFTLIQNKKNMNKNIINNAQLLEIKTKIRQLGAMMNAYQCRFVVSSGQLFFVDDEYAGTVKLTNLDNGESNISFPSCDDGLIINPADKHIK